MTRLSTRLGFWSAFLTALAFVLYVVCYAAILLSAPLFRWTNLADYAAYVQAHSMFFADTARLLMLAFGAFYVVLLNAVHEYARPEHKVLARIALCFGLGFAALIGAAYFLQLSAVRLSIARGRLEGLEQIVQANPLSAVSAVNMLGWSMFLGLSSLFAAPVFSGDRLRATIRAALLANGLFCLLGGAGYLLDNALVVLFTLTFGMGAAVTVAAVGLCRLFRGEQALTGGAAEASALVEARG